MSAGTTITSLVHDGLTDAVYVAAHTPNNPSFIFKLHAKDLTPYGMVQLNLRQGEPEVARAMEAAVRLRRLYVLTSVQQQPVLITLLLSAVRELQPGLADASGGTIINVMGEGFVNGSLCSFGAGILTATTLVRPDLVQCETPATPDSTTCSGNALEIVLTAGVQTQNSVRLWRPATPTVLSVAPTGGYYNMTQVLIQSRQCRDKRCFSQCILRLFLSGSSCSAVCLISLHPLPLYLWQPCALAAGPLSVGEWQYVPFFPPASAVV